jgi:lipid II isoglutaminyl synthase (glutamine-hydrolysing)
MLNPRLTIAILAGKAAGLASRLLRRGGGTTLPGVLARSVNPKVLQLLCNQLAGGVILVAGTNGKTTTTRMLAACLVAGQHNLLHNRAGANLMSPTGSSRNAATAGTLAQSVPRSARPLW